MDGYRGSPALDVQSLHQAVRCLDRLAMANRETLNSADINPLILHQDGSVAVDAVLEHK